MWPLRSIIARCPTGSLAASTGQLLHAIRTCTDPGNPSRHIWSEAQQPLQAAAPSTLDSFYDNTVEEVLAVAA